MVAGMQRIIRETGAEYTNCYLQKKQNTIAGYPEIRVWIYGSRCQ